MTAKDQNLSLNPGLLRATTTPDSFKITPGSAPGIASQRPPSTLAAANESRPQWRAAAAVAALNIAIILGAGYWFLEHSGRLPSVNQTAYADINQTIRGDLAELNIQLSALRDEVQGLRLSQNEQRELTKLSLSQIQQQDKQEKRSNSAKELPAKVAKPVEDKDWYVNLGSFTSPKEASRLKQKMLAIGYQPQIKMQKDQNQTSHKVVLPGFKSRESAEIAAKLLMEQTNLDSLWVWQGSEEV